MSRDLISILEEFFWPNMEIYLGDGQRGSRKFRWCANDLVQIREDSGLAMVVSVVAIRSG